MIFRYHFYVLGTLLSFQWFIRTKIHRIILISWRKIASLLTEAMIGINWSIIGEKIICSRAEALAEAVDAVWDIDVVRHCMEEIFDACAFKGMAASVSYLFLSSKANIRLDWRIHYFQPSYKMAPLVDPLKSLRTGQSIK